MGDTSISWTDRSTNPIKFKLNATAGPAAGRQVNMCVKKSPGCVNCYAEAITRHWWPKDERVPRFPGYTRAALAMGEFVIDPAKLAEVLRFRKPAKFFWADMYDMFLPAIPFELIDPCFAAMALTPRHTHQILTKHPERMAEYFESRRPPQPGWIPAQLLAHLNDPRPELNGENWTTRYGGGADAPGRTRWPLANVWLGTSVENRKCLSRLADLRRCPAAVRWASFEPLLEDLGPCGGELAGLNWAVIGGESGPGARPCDVTWIRRLASSLTLARAAVFVKQMGAKPLGPWVDGIPTSAIMGDDGPWALADAKGEDMTEWPADVRIRQWPNGVPAHAPADRP